MASVHIKTPSGQNMSLSAYTLVCGNDFPSRDPTDWTLEVSVGSGRWEIIDQRQGVVFANRSEALTFAVVPTAPLTSAFRFNVTRLSLRTEKHLQLAELTLEDMPLPLPPKPGTALSRFAATHAAGWEGFTWAQGAAWTLAADCAWVGLVQICACCSVPSDMHTLKEGPLQLVDGNMQTKWHTQWKPSPFYRMYPYISMRLPRPVRLLGYTLTSANDFEQRDPASWYAPGLLH